MVPKAEDPTTLAEEVPVFQNASKDDIAESPTDGEDAAEKLTEAKEKVEGEMEAVEEAATADHTPSTTEEVLVEAPIEAPTEEKQAVQPDASVGDLPVFVTNLISSLSGVCCGLNGAALNTVDPEPVIDERRIQEEKAIQIQKVVRGKLARDSADVMKQELSKTEEAPEVDNATEAEALSEVSSEAARKVAPDAVPEQAPSKPAAKRSFFHKLGSLFSGCKKSDQQVVLSQRASL